MYVHTHITLRQNMTTMCKFLSKKSSHQFILFKKKKNGYLYRSKFQQISWHHVKQLCTTNTLLFHLVWLVQFWDWVCCNAFIDFVIDCRHGLQCDISILTHILMFDLHAAWKIELSQNYRSYSIFKMHHDTDTQKKITHRKTSNKNREQLCLKDHYHIHIQNNKELKYCSTSSKEMSFTPK